MNPSISIRSGSQVSKVVRSTNVTFDEASIGAASPEADNDPLELMEVDWHIPLPLQGLRECLKRYSDPMSRSNRHPSLSRSHRYRQDRTTHLTIKYLSLTALQALYHYQSSWLQLRQLRLHQLRLHQLRLQQLKLQQIILHRPSLVAPNALGSPRSRHVRQMHI
jgi:hypothetical protein